jgi:threonine/homoserine/homoserine lactone efflux protein
MGYCSSALHIIRNIFLGITITATIGPVTIETIRRGLNHGFVSAFAVNMGAVFIDGVYLVVIFFGLSPFAMNAVFRSVLGVAGVLFLLYLGIGDIREALKTASSDSPPPKRSSKYSFVTGMLINATNPLALVAWVGFFGIFTTIADYKPNDIHLLFDISFILVGAAICGFVLSIISHAGKRFVDEKKMKYVSFAAGLVLIAFAFYLGYKTFLTIS